MGIEEDTQAIRSDVRFLRMDMNKIFDMLKDINEKVDLLTIRNQTRKYDESEQKKKIVETLYEGKLTPTNMELVNSRKDTL